MHSDILSDLLNTNQFTGYEHTRTVVLLTLLALISIIMWMVVTLSIIIRFGTVIIMKFLHHRSLRATTALPAPRVGKQR